MDNLVIDLRDQLQRRRGDWPTIAQRAGVSYSWLCKFAGQGMFGNAGYERLMRLNEALQAAGSESEIA
jgi:hypothetical protein